MKLIIISIISEKKFWIVFRVEADCSSVGCCSSWEASGSASGVSCCCSSRTSVMTCSIGVVGWSWEVVVSSD